MAIKKSVKSRKDLQDHALRTGATIQTESKAINTGKVKAPARKKAPAKKAEPPPPIKVEMPVQTEPDPGSVMVAEQLNAMAKSHLTMMDELKQQIAEIQFKAQEPITEWEFEFIRDDKTGYLQKLVATAKTNKRRLN